MTFIQSPSAENLRSLLEKAEREMLDTSIIGRLRVILHFAEHEYSIIETCRFFGISRSTFHRWMERFDPRDLSSLQDRSSEPGAVRQSAVSSEAVELIRRYRMRYVHIGKEKISELLETEQGIVLSPSTVGRIIDRECLYFSDTPFHWKKRMTLKHDEKNSVSSAYQDQESEQAVPVTNQHSLSDSRSTRSLFSLRKFLVHSSVVINIVFVLAMIVMSFYEQSLYTSKSMKQESAPQEFIISPAMHAAPTYTELP